MASKVSNRESKLVTKITMNDQLISSNLFNSGLLLVCLFSNPNILKPLYQIEFGINLSLQSEIKLLSLGLIK
jgi:hypothetical protein